MIKRINKYPLYILLSTMVHSGVLFYALQLEVKAPNLFLSKSAFSPKKIKIKLSQEQLRVKKTVVKNKKIKKAKKKKLVKKIISKKKVIPTKQSPPKNNQKNKQKLNKYLVELKSFVEKNKFYPRMAARLRQSGKVEVKLRIGADGKFGKIEVISPANFDTLNTGAIDLLKRLGHFKPLPDEFLPAEEFIIPIVYTLAGRY